MKCLLLLGAVIFLQNPSPRGVASHEQQPQSQGSQQPPPPDQRGTEQAPLFIKQLPTPNTDEESAQESNDRTEKTANDRKLVEFTGFLAAIGFFQLIVFGLQARRLRQAVEASTAQSKDMKESIAQAARTAKAMEDVAKHLDRSVAEAKASAAIFAERGQMQMRAYICVEVGTAAYQVQETNTKFAAQTIMLNTGNTPAHEVGFRAKAAILPIPLPEDFDFTLLGPTVGGSVLGPHQRMTITRIVEDFIPDGQVPGTKVGSGQALYIWGVIEYVDVFSSRHTTKFCQILNWPDGKTVIGTYITKHNDAT